MQDANSSFSLPARYVAQLLDVLEAGGVDRAPLLRAAHIRSIESPTAQVTHRQFEALLRAAELASGRSDLGFEFGRRLDPTTHDVLGFAMLTSPTLGHMLQLAVTYQRLMQPYFALRMHRSRDRAELVYTPVAALSHRAMRVLEEAIVLADHSGFVSTLRDRLPPYEVWMSIERPPHASRYRDLLNVKANFADPVPGVRISLPARLLDAPLVMANPRAMRAAEDRCKTILRGANARRRWSEWCRTMLRESEDSRPTLAQLARFMNISSRTLARYLESEGSSFRELSLEVRTARAKQLLADGAASVTQIAYRLGYTDVASFIRSFKARTGRPPGAKRRTDTKAHS